ncbi:Crossover junction endonuclease EME1B [Platanthera guangdongensis]|uniref:Crossover junction endonuclease EME1B n=1 Tax=Platanthera guangdongensis TaxID=2320717 RepID=A0ABR2MTS7_9ASPA
MDGSDHQLRSRDPVAPAPYSSFPRTSRITGIEYCKCFELDQMSPEAIEIARVFLEPFLLEVIGRFSLDSHVLAGSQERKKIIVKKLTWLSVNANGSSISNGFIDKKLIKNNVWMKALVSIPKVQPKHAVAIWKKYPTMRSLLEVYMNSSLSVHEKEFLLKDLMVEGLLGKEDRRLGELCSKRIFRILMARSGGIRTDDAEDGADLFKP